VSNQIVPYSWGHHYEQTVN